jgi:hypothetical protein
VVNLVTRSMTASRAGTSTPITFETASIDLEGTSLSAADTWKITELLNGFDAGPVTGLTNLNAIAGPRCAGRSPHADGVAGALTGMTVGGSGEVITIGFTAGFTVAVSTAGVDPRGSAVLDGTPTGQTGVVADLGAQVKLINWTQASITLGGTRRDGERWTLSAASANTTAT